MFGCLDAIQEDSFGLISGTINHHYISKKITYNLATVFGESSFTVNSTDANKGNSLLYNGKNEGDASALKITNPFPFQLSIPIRHVENDELQCSLKSQNDNLSRYLYLSHGKSSVTISQADLYFSPHHLQ